MSTQSFVHWQVGKSTDLKGAGYALAGLSVDWHTVQLSTLVLTCWLIWGNQYSSLMKLVVREKALVCFICYVNHLLTKSGGYGYLFSLKQQSIRYWELVMYNKERSNVRRYFILRWPWCRKIRHDDGWNWTFIVASLKSFCVSYVQKWIRLSLHKPYHLQYLEPDDEVASATTLSISLRYIMMKLQLIVLGVQRLVRRGRTPVPGVDINVSIAW